MTQNTTTNETNTSGKPMRARIYVAFNGISSTLYYPVKIVESGNMRTVFTSDNLAISQQWIKDNGYTEAHAPYYSKEVVAQIANNKVRAVATTPPAAAKAPKPRQPRPTDAQKYIAKLEDMDTPAILKVLKAEGFSHLLSPADYGEIHNWALEILLRSHFGVEAVATYQKARNARYAAALAAVCEHKRSFEGKCTECGASAESQPAALAPTAPAVKATAIVYRDLGGGIFHHTITCKNPTRETFVKDGMVFTHIGKCVCGGTMEAEFVAPRPARLYEHMMDDDLDKLIIDTRFDLESAQGWADRENDSDWVANMESAREAKRIPALKASLETMMAERDTRDNAAVKATPDSATPAALATPNEQVIALPIIPSEVVEAHKAMTAALNAYWSQHRLMETKRGRGRYMKQVNLLIADSETLHNLGKRLGQAATAYAMAAQHAEAENE